MLAICVHYPFSQLLISGKKKLEIRTWPFPKKFINEQIGIIEVFPGKPSKLIGSVQFTKISLIQTEKDFLSLADQHKILDYPEKFKVKKFPVFAWHVEKKEAFKNHEPIKGFLGIKKINPSFL